MPLTLSLTACGCLSAGRPMIRHFFGRRVSVGPWQVACRRLVTAEPIHDGVQDKSAEGSALSFSCGPDCGSFPGSTAHQQSCSLLRLSVRTIASLFPRSFFAVARLTLPH